MHCSCRLLLRQSVRVGGAASLTNTDLSRFLQGVASPTANLAPARIGALCVLAALTAVTRVFSQCTLVYVYANVVRGLACFQMLCM